ncbi:hypothetical protein GDO86_009226 [Hymenochirus boettgeri]|uniref:COMM domain-containing protein 1 n=1 Tax=Hymenochirus boettgeri TaxID=247094 RepID=A0A8T2JMW8_9PIPI|nr:hypothetical protein GDO86_009226 [Hymenochirus boettgeri]
MADPDSAKTLTGLLNGIAQGTYYGNSEITDDLLKSELYPEVPVDQFRALLDKMKGLIKTKKQGGITAEQAAVIAKFWKNHKTKIKENMITQTRWENSLKGMNWRIDLKSQSSLPNQENAPVAIVEMEIGKNDKESDFLYLEFNETKINHMIKQLTAVEEQLTALTQST